MEIIKEIGLQVVEILTLIFGILGMTFSAMLIFSPGRTKNFSKILNRNVNVDEKIGFLDKDIEISDYFYSHHVIAGLMLIAGSAFALFFFYFSLDIAKFTTVFWGNPDHIFFGEIFISAILWVGKITCLVGLLIGVTLMLAPDKMRRMENKLNSWFETRSIFKKLDQSSNEIDSFFFRYPLPVGLTGAIISFIILSLSIINLLD
jgi:hypothetical protein